MTRIRGDLLGPLRAVHPLWRDRPAQRAMAEAVARAIDDEETLLIDAPTGIGKSLAALAPIGALGAEAPRAAYATGTIALQEQLLRKDLPLVQQAFDHPEAALLKGMGHYLCRLKAEGPSLELPIAADVPERNAFTRWVSGTDTGDWTELPRRPSFWSDVAASSSDCTGPRCPHFPPPEPRDEDDDDEARRRRFAFDAWMDGAGAAPPCFAYLARLGALRAALVVANHHALLFLLRFLSGKVPPLLVIDEGHKLAAAATAVWTDELDELRFARFARRVERELPRDEDVDEALTAAQRAYTAMLRELPFPKDEPLLLPVRCAGLEMADNQLGVLDARLGEAMPGGRGHLVRTELAHFRQTLAAVLRPDPARARWVEQKQAHRLFRAAPIETGPILAPLFTGAGPRIVMSATLAAGGDFSLLEHNCGIAPGQARHLRLPPCFDFARQLRYFLPYPARDPRREGYLDAVGPIVRELVLASRGRALILCTAFAQVDALRQALAGVPYPVLVGDRDSPSLAEEFHGREDSILIGTARYWEGLDVPGPACSLVVIVRLPFDRPDPLLQARYDAAEARGEHWFPTLALPEAVLKLRQGVGRLIRTETDRGIVALLDGRLQTKPYGRTILDALPTAGPPLRQIEEVAAFFDESEEDRA